MKDNFSPETQKFLHKKYINTSSKLKNLDYEKLIGLNYPNSEIMCEIVSEYCQLNSYPENASTEIISKINLTNNRAVIEKITGNIIEKNDTIQFCIDGHLYNEASPILLSFMTNTRYFLNYNKINSMRGLLNMSANKLTFLKGYSKSIESDIYYTLGKVVVVRKNKKNKADQVNEVFNLFANEYGKKISFKYVSLIKNFLTKYYDKYNISNINNEEEFRNKSDLSHNIINLIIENEIITSYGLIEKDIRILFPKLSLSQIENHLERIMAKGLVTKRSELFFPLTITFKEIVLKEDFELYKKITNIDFDDRNQIMDFALEYKKEIKRILFNKNNIYEALFSEIFSKYYLPTYVMDFFQLDVFSKLYYYSKNFFEGYHRIMQLLEEPISIKIKTMIENELLDNNKIFQDVKNRIIKIDFTKPLDYYPAFKYSVISETDYTEFELEEFINLAGFNIEGSIIVFSDKKINDILNTEPILDFSNNPVVFQDLNLFNLIQSKKDRFEIFEIEKNIFISLNELAKYDISKELLVDFCKTCISVYKNQVYSLKKIKASIDIPQQFHNFNLNIFLNGLLYSYGNIKGWEINNKSLFVNFKTKDILSEYIHELLEKEKSIYIEDIIHWLAEQHDISTNSNIIKKHLPPNSFFSDEINKIYINKDYFLDEFKQYKIKYGL